MDILVALRPTNMSIREVASCNRNVPVTTYVFNNHEYTHVGTWPPVHVAGFHVPIATAEVIATQRDITRTLKRFAGPRHTVTPQVLQHALGTWTWRPHIRVRGGGISLVFEPFLVIPDDVPSIRVTDVLGHVSVFCAK